MAEQHRWQVADLQAAAAGPPNRATTVALLGRLLSMRDAETRTCHLARFELFLEGTRCAELRPVLRDIRAAAEQSAAVVLRAGGVVASPDRVRLLVRLVSGLAFDQLTIPAEPLDTSAAAEVVDGLLTLVIGRDD